MNAVAGVMTASAWSPPRMTSDARALPIVGTDGPVPHAAPLGVLESSVSIEQMLRRPWRRAPLVSAPSWRKSSSVCGRRGRAARGA